MCMVHRVGIGFRAGYHHVKLNAFAIKVPIYRNIYIYIQYKATSDYY